MSVSLSLSPNCGENLASAACNPPWQWQGRHADYVFSPLQITAIIPRNSHLNNMTQLSLMNSLI